MERYPWGWEFYFTCFEGLSKPKDLRSFKSCHVDPVHGGGVLKNRRMILKNVVYKYNCNRLFEMLLKFIKYS